MTINVVSYFSRVGLFAAIAAISFLVSAGCLAEDYGSKESAAKALLRFSPTESKIIGQKSESFNRDRFEIYKNTQKQLLVSRFVLLAALRKPEINKLPVIREIQDKGADPVNWLQAKLSAGFLANSEIMEVSFSGVNADEGVILTNAVVDAYMSEIVCAERDQKRIRLSELDRAYVEKERDIRHKREELKKSAKTLGTSTPETLDARQNLAMSEFQARQQEESEVRRDVRRLKIELAGQKAMMDHIAASGKLSDEVKAEKLAGRQTEIKRLEASIAAANEEYRNVQAEVEKTRNEVHNVATTSVDIEMMRAEIKNLEKVLSCIANEREILKVECRANVRVSLLKKAERPE